MQGPCRFNEKCKLSLWVIHQLTTQDEDFSGYVVYVGSLSEQVIQKGVKGSPVCRQFSSPGSNTDVETVGCNEAFSTSCLQISPLDKAVGFKVSSPKCPLWTSSVSITWVLVRNADSRTLPRPGGSEHLWWGLAICVLRSPLVILMYP